MSNKLLALFLFLGGIFVTAKVSPQGPQGGTVGGGGAGGAVCGSNSQVLFNNAGACGANSTFTYDGVSSLVVGGSSGTGSLHLGNTGLLSGSSTSFSTFQNFQGKQVIADFGTACTNGELALSAGWGTSPTVTGVSGNGQTCKWTITSGTGTPTANPTITDTLTNVLPDSTTVCRVTLYNPATGAVTAAEDTTISATAPIFTVYFTPATSTAYRWERTCGP